MMPLLPPSCPCPAISEAIQVPCTPQFGLARGVRTPVRSGPVITEPARSDTSGLTPLSMTATVAPWPWVTGHAWGALTASSTHIWALAHGVRAGQRGRGGQQGADGQGEQERPGRGQPWPAGGGQHAGPPGQRGGGGEAPMRDPIQSDSPLARLSISSLS